MTQISRESGRGGGAEVVAPPRQGDTVGTAPGRPSFDGFVLSNWLVVIALVLVVAVFSLLAPGTYLTAFNIRAMLAAAAVPAVLGIGQTFVVLTGGIDLSVASVLALSAVCGALVFAGGFPLPAALVAAVLVGLLTGLLTGALIAWLRIADFIATLGMLSLASGVALVLARGNAVPMIDRRLAAIANTGLGPVPTLLIIAVALALAGHVILFSTRFGTHVLATGGDAEVARAVGINVARVRMAVYAISGTCAGVAAILVVARIGAGQPAANTALLLTSVAAVVLGGVSLFGGRGTVLGPFAGALLLQALVNGLTVTGVEQYWQFVAIGSVVLLAATVVRQR